MADEVIKISVIVPVYNEMKYLDTCVSSICNQSYRNLEIILVDDGSGEPCHKLCDEYLVKDRRIKVIHKENGGSLSARRKGIEEAEGDYVAFVDSDDWVELDFYEKMAELIAGNKPDMAVASNYYRDYPDGQFVKVYDNKRAGYWTCDEFETEVFPYFIKTEEFFDTEFPIAMTYYMFDTSFARRNILKIEDKIKTSEDYTFLMLAFLNARSFAANSFAGYHYRSNVNSKTHTLKNMKDLLRPSYEAVMRAIHHSDYAKDNLEKKNRLHMYHALMLKDYGELLNSTDTFLFPFSRVRKGSRILIYGMGLLGKQIYNALKDNPAYDVAGVADRKWELLREQGEYVVSPDAILSLEYDFIIIAITYPNIKNQVKKELINMGIDADKIADVDLTVLDEEHLPFKTEN